MGRKKNKGGKAGQQADQLQVSGSGDGRPAKVPVQSPPQTEPIPSATSSADVGPFGDTATTSSRQGEQTEQGKRRKKGKAVSVPLEDLYISKGASTPAEIATASKGKEPSQRQQQQQHAPSPQKDAQFPTLMAQPPQPQKQIFPQPQKQAFPQPQKQALPQPQKQALPQPQRQALQHLGGVRGDQPVGYGESPKPRQLQGAWAGRGQPEKALSPSQYAGQQTPHTAGPPPGFQTPPTSNTQGSKQLAPLHSQTQNVQQQRQSSLTLAPPSSSQQLVVQSTASNLAEMKSKVYEYQMLTVKGVKGGTLGKRIKIETNHLALTLGNLKQALHYDVDIKPPGLPRKLFRQAMEAFRCKNFPNRFPAFDGSKNLYAAKELPFTGSLTSEIDIVDDERGRKVVVTVKFATVVDLSLLREYFKNGITPQAAIQCLDVVLRNAPSLVFTPVGRSFFSPPRDQIIPLGQGMEMYYGFYQSAILGWKPFLNIDICHKPFPKKMTITESITELCPRADLNRNLPPEDADTLSKFIKMLKVKYEIPNNPMSKKIYRVNGLRQAANVATFTTERGDHMTIEAYFRDEKNYRLRFPNLPCIWVGKRDRESPILLPAELCTIIEGQVTNRKMTPQQTTEMIRKAAVPTDVRKQRIMSNITNARFNKDSAINEFGITVNDRFETVDARVLPIPRLQYSTSISPVLPNNGAWRASQFVNPMNLVNWTMFCADFRTKEENMHKLADLMIRQGRSLGMDIAKARQPFGKLARRGGSPKEELKHYFLNNKMQLTIVVVPDSGDTYSAVKQAAELCVGCLTQCIRSGTLYRINPATVTNLLLKINAKLNGTNHYLYERPLCLARPCMIMGADVTHPPPDSTGPSVAAVTGSYDPKGFKYNICWRLQSSRLEIIQDLQAITHDLLTSFFKQNKAMKPERIIIFRDGVSEGQFAEVLDAELRAIRAACLHIQQDGNYKPRITFLVVQKRHHTRFFPIDIRDCVGDRNKNLPPGTIVDTMITHPTNVDFYLLSHSSFQGVARPTRYRKLWDDCNMNDDELEQLTFHLCHMFSRCTRSVSYPAPTYYAHLAAARAKVYCDNHQTMITDDNMQAIQKELKIQTNILSNSPMFFV